MCARSRERAPTISLALQSRAECSAHSACSSRLFWEVDCPPARPLERKGWLVRPGKSRTRFTVKGELEGQMGKAERRELKPDENALNR